MSAWGVFSQRGVSAQGVFCPGGCVCLEGVSSRSSPPVDRMTDTCINITLPQLRCGRLCLLYTYPCSYASTVSIRLGDVNVAVDSYLVIHAVNMTVIG